MIIAYIITGAGIMFVGVLFGVIIADVTATGVRKAPQMEKEND